MVSKAEATGPAGVPAPAAPVAEALAAAPTLSGAARQALGDFFFNSWRLVAANVAWGVGVVAIGLIALTVPLLGLVLAPLLAIPTVGVYRLAALVARGEPASFWDAVEAWRAYAVPALAAGMGATVTAAVLGVNVVGGLLSGSALGWALATLAAWGLAVAWLVALAFWPLLTDPRRDGARQLAGLRPALRLAGLLVLAHPVRLAVLGLLALGILVASSVAFAALVTVSVAYVALLSSRYLLPAADRLEARLATR